MEESISIQRVKQSVISIDFSGCIELSEKCNGQQVFAFHSFKLRTYFWLERKYAYIGFELWVGYVLVQNNNFIYYIAKTKIFQKLTLVIDLLLLQSYL